ncbi:MAG: proton-conducting transporter membrane subunit [Candidatus Wallbacteria bacterium]|nr:proton-conducting transporter membrane subunit [Candidatus Wallbacteria bacterium]
MTQLITGIFILFFAAVLTPALKHKTRDVFFVIAVVSASCLVLFSSFSALYTGTTQTLSFDRDIFGTVRLEIDPLTAFFLLIFALIGGLGAFYTVGYHSGHGRSSAGQFFFYPLLLASMMALVLVRNGLAFLFCWEMMAIFSYFLIMHEHEKKEVQDTGMEYLIFMHVSLVFLSIGFALLSIKSGSFDFAAWKKLPSPYLIRIFPLLIAGFGLKAGLMPFHVWLPKAHPAAPSNVSAIMSGAMIKTGIYGLVRYCTLIESIPIWTGVLVLVLGTVTAVFGILTALGQKDIKKVLAYSSVENVGIIGMGLGLGLIGNSLGNLPLSVLGYSSCLLHVFNHALFKTLLFFGAGSVFHATGERNVELLGGLSRAMPWTTFFFLCGSVSISGLPPFNGFISEFLLYSGLLHCALLKSSGLIVLAVAAMAYLSFVGVMSMMCFGKIFSIAFLGISRSGSEQTCATSESTLSMLVPMGLLSSACLVAGLVPSLLLGFTSHAVSQLARGTENFSVIPSLNRISQMSLAAIIVSALVYLMRCSILKFQGIRTAVTWGCGYQNLSPRLQYTGSSFVSRFLVLMKPVLNSQITYREPSGAFPVSSSFESHSRDLFEWLFLYPVRKSFRFLKDYFGWLQTGSTQQYIRYGLVFLLLTLLGVLGMNR